MMNLTHTPDQQYIDALFLSASKLDEDMYVGDVFIDDEGVAKTHIIKADKSTEQVVLDKELQDKFQSLVTSSASKTSAVIKLTNNTDKETTND